VPQEVVLAAGGDAPYNVFQHRALRPDAPRTLRPLSVGRGKQLSGGVTGWYLYELRVGGDVEGRVWSTSPAPGAGLEPDSEYWDVNVSRLRGRSFTLALVSTGGSGPPTPRHERQWRATLGSLVSSHTGSLGPTDTTYRADPSEPLILLQLGATFSTWVRESADLLFEHSQEPLVFVPCGEGGCAYQERVWSQDPHWDWELD
jgi:hypothetical protein